MMLAQFTNETPDEALRLIDFWRQAGRELWFAKDPAFDELFTESFMQLYEAAANGQLDYWTSTACGSLALIILLDQFPRNAFRGTPRAYATDAHARRIAMLATSWGHDLMIDLDLRVFVYMPFGHSESLADHKRGGELMEHMGPPYTDHAKKYLAVIERFGRYPHRNPILGRETTSDEEEFLRNGGFSG
jgi:uncharacterized protein (DUF924 family)